MSAKTYELVTLCPFLRKDQLRVCFKKCFNQKILPKSSELSQKIDQYWNEKLKENPNIWNATKFRYCSSYYDPKANVCTFNTGLSDYKSFITTNISPYYPQLEQLGLKENNDKFLYIGNPMGNQNLVLTKDGYAVYMRVSRTHVQGGGRLAGPGGHPEPDNVQISEAPEEENEELNQLIVNELFNSSSREIFEEINIPISSLYVTRLLGFMSNLVTNGRQGILFLAKTTLTKDEVYDAYMHGPVDKIESDYLEFIKFDDITHDNIPPYHYVPEVLSIFEALHLLYKQDPILYDEIVNM
ncbi:hypothetical protein WA158_002024 [Blastocystis sp. Blastoise]